MVRCCSSRTDKAVVRIASFNELTEEIPNYRVSPYSRENERKRGGRGRENDNYRVKLIIAFYYPLRKGEKGRLTSVSILIRSHTPQPVRRTGRWRSRRRRKEGGSRGRKEA